MVFLLLPVVTGDKAVDDEEAAVEGSDSADHTENADVRRVITELEGCFDRLASEN